MNKSEIKTKFNYNDYDITNSNNPIKSNPTIKLLLNYLTNEDQKKIIKNIIDANKTTNPQQTTIFNRLNMYKDKKKVKSLDKTKNQSIPNYQTITQRRKTLQYSNSPQFPPIKKKQEQQIKKEKNPKITIKPKIVTQNSTQSPVKQKKRKFPTQFNFYLGPGNNHEVIRRVMQDRKSNWTEVQLTSQIIHFKWQQTQQGYNYEKLICDGIYLKEMVNLFENHKELTSKIGLVKSLIKYFDYNLDTTFSILPIAFILNFQSKTWQQDVDSFVNFYVSNSPKEQNKTSLNLNFYKQKQFANPYKNYNVTYDQSIVNEKIKIQKLQKVYMGTENYLWLLKPADWNRGDGVHVFSTLEELEDLLKKYYSGWIKQLPKIVQLKKKLTQIDSKKESSLSADNLQYKNIQSIHFLFTKENLILEFGFYQHIKCNFISLKKDIQELVVRNLTSKITIPLCIQLITQFRGFLKIMDPLKMEINFPSTIFKNILSSQSFQFIYQSEFESGYDFKSQIIPKIKEMIISTMYSVKRQINRKNRKFCFQLFGYDFIIDNNFAPWLIEVNTNPCLEESSSLLKMIIPRMINDLLKMTIDELFIKFSFEEFSNLEEQEEKIDYEKYIKYQGNGCYPIKNYGNNENMWEYLGCF